MKPVQVASLAGGEKNVEVNPDLPRLNVRSLNG